MKTHYYLGWFNNYFPKELKRVLLEDIKDRKSLVMISSDPSLGEVDGSTERSWLDEAGILFDEYYLINHQVEKEAANHLISQASVIFLLGGNTIEQNKFLHEYELPEPIKNSKAVIVGASAGAINMSAKWLCSKKLGFEVEEDRIYNGIGLHHFSVLSHFDLENNMVMVQEELSPLSEEMDIYISNKDCAVRVKGEKIDIYGDVYLLSKAKMKKLEIEKINFSINSVTSEEELRSLVGYPSELVKNKTIAFLDYHCIDFIAKSPFLVMSTCDEKGKCDVSPRGDLKGFVLVLNEKQLLIPERTGNKRMDSLRNILSNPNIGLVFFIPGLGETLRVNGRATIVKDEELLKNLAVGNKIPQLGIGIDVEECFIHCAKAFKRSLIWDPETWMEKSQLPSASKILFEHVKSPNTTMDDIQKRLEDSYINRLY